MKLVLLFAAGALAAQDTTPPVISLTMSAPLKTCSEVTAFHSANGATQSWHQNNKEYQALNCPAPCHKCENATRDSNTAESVTCEVTDPTHGSSSVSYTGNECPEPRCTVYDHYQNHARGHTPPACAKQYYLVNDNGVADGSSAASLNRGLRSEWLIRYSAEDAAGNAAENVTFSMIFVDTQAPELTTEFGTSGPSYNRDQEYPEAINSGTCSASAYNAGTCTHSWFQSCTETDTAPSLYPADDTQPSCTNNIVEAFQSSSNPCIRSLTSGDVSILDNYDAPADIKDTIEVEIYYQETQNGSWIKQVGPVRWDSTDLKIDTQKTGLWQVKYVANDLAGIFGFDEKDNVVKQTVTFTVEDSLPPIVTLDAHHSVTTKFDTPAGEVPVYSSSGAAADSSCTYGNDNTDFEITLECRKPLNCQGAVKGGTKHASDNECGSFYVEPGAKCKDLRGSWDEANGDWNFDAALVGGANMTLHGSQIVSTTSANTHVVTYTCEETQTYGGPANTHTSVGKRSITVQDTIAPVVQLKGQSAIQNSAGVDNGNAGGAAHDGMTHYEKDNGSGDYLLHVDSLLADQNAQCQDLCDTTPVITSVLSYGDDCDPNKKVNGTHPSGSVKNFPEYTPGDYSIRYTCYDGHGSIKAGTDQTVHEPSGDRDPLSSYVCMHIENVDKTKPIIQVLGSDVMTLEATHSGNYVDDGATCWDRVDGVISQNVEVSGDVVNLSKVGTYVITYNCKDSAGQTANPISRTVHVAQTSCPRCDMTGCTGVYDTADWNCTTIHEASFPYTDFPVACSDSIDGNVATEVVGTVNSDVTGTYVLEYKAKNSAGLYNDEASCDNTPKSYYRTVTVKDTLVPVVEVKFRNEVVGRSDAHDVAVHNSSEANPADTHQFMGEVTAHRQNAWALGAFASAIAGVALLAASRQRSATISVPV